MQDGEPRVAERRLSGFLAIAALAVPVAVCGIPGHRDSTTWIAAEAGVLALLVGVVGFESTAPAGLLAIVTSVLSLNGFTEDRYGQLGWHPGVDFRVDRRPRRRLGLAYAARGGVDQRLAPQPEYWVHELGPEDGDR